MKVLLINGSPHKNGCANRALEEIAKTLSKEGIDSEIFYIGTKPISGCIACGKCNELHKCAIDDCVNEFIEKAKTTDAFVFASPVHYAAISGALSSFMDRAFFAGSRAEEKIFYLKPAAAVVCARRAGTTAAFDQLNKYFTISQMPVISSQYWNNVHGFTPDDVERDLEGLQIMRTLARNMAWFLKCKEAGKNAGVHVPEVEIQIATHFI